MSITITTAATDLTLLTEAELRAAIGVETGYDAEVARLNLRLAAAITKACKVASSGIKPPTLRLETITEKQYFTTQQSALILARRPIYKITSITLDGTLLNSITYDGSGNITTPSTDYEVDGFMVRRLSGSYLADWCGSVVSIVYQAGWATVPDDLKYAVEQLAASYWADAQRTPGLRSMEIPGVISETYQDMATDSPALPTEVMQLLHQGGYVIDYVG